MLYHVGGMNPRDDTKRRHVYETSVVLQYIDVELFTARKLMSPPVTVDET